MKMVSCPSCQSRANQDRAKEEQIVDRLADPDLFGPVFRALPEMDRPMACMQASKLRLVGEKSPLGPPDIE